MNPENTNTQPVMTEPQPQTGLPPVIPAATTAAPQPASAPQVVTASATNSNPSVATQTSTTKTPKMPNFNFKFGSFSKKTKILISLVIFLFVLLLLLSLTSAGQRVKNSILPSPTPSPEATPNLPGIGEPSAYATDPEVIDIENRVGDFEKSLNTTSLKEDTLRPPQVDWDVTFKK
jgi:hypothetical protein